MRSQLDGNLNETVADKLFAMDGKLENSWQGSSFLQFWDCPSCVSGMTSEVRLSGRLSNVLYAQCGGRLCDNAMS